ncbi:hypothetical protein MLD38_018866 [Melastoma candidum]|uniref:Uncharacterized protein n=1 Tax=Melastoma candidum TaxID=119954 RepID=A0ACB9QUC5_9MYRT|nr:hypothetical protein MLD38_018866 [Melastoma candidum]
MWKRWSSNSPTRSSGDRSTTFSCSSFKDIQALVKETPLNPTHHSRTLSIFNRVRISTSILRALSRPPPAWSPPAPSPPPTIVLYFTSLRIVRKTFEDCWSVRSILRGFRVPIDERDLSMDDGFREELQGMLGKGRRQPVLLPCVFIGGRFIGGAEEVVRMHETGELKQLIGSMGLPAAGSGACGACGGLRFVVCEECSGSHKVYSEKSGFRSCTACNVSGLIRCGSCCGGAGGMAGAELVLKKN